MTRQELAQKVKAKYPELQGVDDETVVASVLDQHPSYSAYLTDDDIGSNVVIESAKQFGLGAAETIGQAAEGAVLNLSLSMADKTMTEQEFYNSPESLKNVSYDRYVRLNNIKLEKQKKGMEFADAIKGWTEEKLPEYLNANEEYGNTFAGQVFRGLGQFLGYGTVGTAGTVASFGGPVGGVASVYGTAFFNRQIEFLEDAERTLGLDLMEMDKETRDKIVGGSWAYGLTTGALDATVFKYITRVPGANTPTVKNLLTNLVRGEGVPSGQLKTVLANTAKAAFAEGTQESLGDGLTLDALAKSLYDDDRELITGDALGRRVTEFALGGTVGGLGKTGIDLIRPAPRTAEEVKKFKDVLKKVDEKLKTVEGETDQQKFKIQFEQKSSGETDITEVKANSPEEALEIFNETYKGMYEPDSGRIYTGEVEVQETAPEKEVVEETVVTKEPEGIEDIEGKVIDDGSPMVKEPVGIQEPEGKPVDDTRPIDPENLRLSVRKGVPLNNERTPIIDSSLQNLTDEELEAYGNKVESEVYKIETEFDNQTEEEETVEFLEKMGKAQDELFSFEIEDFRRQVNYAIEGYKDGTFEDIQFLREKLQELPDTPSGNVKLALLLESVNKANLLPELANEFKNEMSQRISRDPTQAGNISEVGEFQLQQIIQRGTDALRSLEVRETDLTLEQMESQEEGEQGFTSDFLIDASEIKESPDLRLGARKPKNVPTIKLKDFKGQRVFFLFADQTRVGTYKGLDGNLNISLQGGPDYPNTKVNKDNDIGWAVDAKGIWTSLNNKVNLSSKGVGFVTLFPKDNLRGNKTFLKAYVAEVRNAIKKGRLTEKRFLEVANELRNSLINSAANEGPSIALGGEFTSLNNFQQRLGDSRFDVRGQSFFKTSENVKGEMTGQKIGKAEYVKEGFPDIVKMIDLFADPRFKGLGAGTVVSAVQFQQGQTDFISAEQAKVPAHSAYEFLIKGKGLGYFDKPFQLYDQIKDLYRSAQPTRKYGEKKNIPQALKPAEGEVRTFGVDQQGKRIVGARRPKTNAEVELDIVANFTQNYLNDKFGSIIESDEFKLPSGKKLKLYMGVDAGVFGPQDQDSTASYDPVTHTITVNLRNMNAKTFTKESLSATMREEIIHALAAVRAVKKYGKNVTTDNLFALTQAEYFENLGKNLSKSQRLLIEKVYNYGDPMNDYTAGAEYFRAAVQNFSYGMITEETNTMKQGKAWDTVKKLIRDLQAFVTKAFKLTSDPQGVALIADVANLLAKIDPEARPVDQKTVLAARKVMSPVTGEPVLNIGDFTEDPIVKAKKSILKPLILPKKTKELTFAEAYLVPAGQTLRNIHASLEKAFTDYLRFKDGRINDLHRLAESFATKFKGIKDKADKQALTQLISFSKFDNEGSQFTDEQAQELYSKRDALLDKYGMFNDYLAITQALKQIRHEVITYVGDIGFVENYWPRYLSPKKYKELRQKYGLDEKTFKDAIEAENKKRKENTVKFFRVFSYDAETNIPTPGNLYPTRREAQAEADSLGNSFVKDEEVQKELPPMEKGGVEEALFIEKLLSGRGFDPKAGKPKFTKTRKLEIIPEEELEFYDSPTKALSRYFSSMVSLIETTKFLGRMQPDTRVVNGQTIYQYDPSSKLAQTVQDLVNRPDFDKVVDQEKLYQTLPEITRMLMAKGGKEFGLFAWFRNFSYGTLLIEFTSTLSQLYDLPFTMYDNGFFETLKSAANVATGKGIADVRELFDINRIMDAYENDSDFFADIIKTGLKITGFTKMDQFMKETTMDANYKRYLKVSKDINPDGTIKDGVHGKRKAEANKALAELNIFLASTNPDFQQQDIQRFLQAVKTDPNQRTQYQNDLIKSVLLVKLFENQPMNILRLPPKISENPNLRGLITMKSFMLVQINSTRNIALNDLFGNGRTKSERLEAAKRLAKLIGFFIAIGIPVDALKDWLVGRPGYLPDYAFNGAVRVFGINKFLFFQLRKEGLGQAMLDFTLPVPLARGIGVLNEMSAVAQGEGPIESGIVKNMPFSDVFYYRVPEVREKQRKFVQRRRKQEGEFLFGLPDPFEQLAPEPLINPFR